MHKHKLVYKYKLNYDKTAKDDFKIGNKVMIWEPGIVVACDVRPRFYMVKGSNGVLKRILKHLRLAEGIDKIIEEIDNDDLVIGIIIKR